MFQNHSMEWARLKSVDNQFLSLGCPLRKPGKGHGGSRNAEYQSLCTAG